MEQRPEWWPYPEQCQAGHARAPGRVVVGWHPCDCPAVLAAQEARGAGHLVVHCAAAGCTSTWYRPKHGPG